MRRCVCVKGSGDSAEQRSVCQSVAPNCGEKAGKQSLTSRTGGHHRPYTHTRAMSQSIGKRMGMVVIQGCGGCECGGGNLNNVHISTETTLMAVPTAQWTTTTP
jgi:hypothetical protein